MAEEDVYICPAGERLAYSFTTEENGLVLHRYWTNACQSCAIKHSCTTGKKMADSDELFHGCRCPFMGVKRSTSALETTRLTHSDAWQRLSCRQSERKPESLCSHRVLSLDLSRRWGRGDTQRGRTNLDHSIVHAARTAITNKTMDAAAKSTNLIMTLFTSAWTRLWEIRSAT